MIIKNIFQEGTLDTDKLHKHEGAGGTTITRYTCAFCGDDYVSGTTAHPDLCKNCTQLIVRLEKHGMGESELVQELVYFMATKIKKYRELIGKLEAHF